jgi:hypothetical protein
MSSVMQAANECKDDAKQAMSNATMQCQCDVMQHPFLRSISPLIAVAENKCRAFRIQMCTCQLDCSFGKTAKDYLT